MAGEAEGPAGDLRKQVESLTAKVVELEQKLSKFCITEEEWMTYRKVAAILAGQAALPDGVRDDAAAGSKEDECGHTIFRRPSAQMKALRQADIGQGHSIVIPSIIIVGGFGGLGS
jgi:hypothetical protein